MSKYLRFRVTLLFVGMRFLQTEITCSADDATKRRFLAEYPQAAKILKNRWDRCSGSYRLISVDEKIRQDPYSVTFSRSQGFEKFEVSIVRPAEGKPIEGTLVYCLGDDGSFFSISKMKGDTKYKLSSYSANETQRMVHETDFGRCVRASLGGYERPLITMIENKMLTLVDAKPVLENKNLIESTFQLSNDSPLTQLVVKFDTTNHWAVVEQSYFVGSPPKNQASYHVDYGEKRNGVAFPIRFKASEENVQYAFGEWKFDESPREAFSLTHYGLPDLIESNKRKRWIGPLEFYLIAGMIVSSLSGLGFFLLSKSSGHAKVTRDS